jgi:hypothetical protein
VGIVDGTPIYLRPARRSSADHGRWRKKLFIATSRVSGEEAEHYPLPLDQTVIVGSRIDV